MAETKIWNGSAWVSVRPKVYNGTAWETEGRMRTSLGWQFMYPDIEEPIAVNALADGRQNDISESVSTTCYSGVRFLTDGDEREYLWNGTSTSVNTWLTSGLPSQAWVAFFRTAGQATWDSGQTDGTRYQLNTSRNFYVFRSGTGLSTITGYFRFYDAATGGNILDTTVTAQYSAWVTIDGCPLCCFTPDTLITMADGSVKPIVYVEKGDLVRVLNGIETVGEVLIRERRTMCAVTFSDGRVLHMSDDHPIYVEGKGYAAVNPVVPYKDLGMAKVLEAGDRVATLKDNTVKIEKIESLHYPFHVYTLDISNFFANGILVY